jgi:nucleolar GTP-binding protein
MNKAELQAVLALRYLAKVVVFLVNPTHHSGFDLSIQMNIFNNIKK